MKLQITTHKTTTRSFNEGTSWALILNHISYHTDLAILSVIQQYNIPASAFTEKPCDGCYEFVVLCIQRKRYGLLDKIFSAGEVSPDLISSNGSPLMLFAMQAGVQMFRYMLSQGAKLIISGDFISNKSALSLTAMWCANDDPEIMNALFNVLAGPVGESVTNVATFEKFMAKAALKGRSHEVSIFKTRIGRLRVAESVGTAPESKLVTFVRDQCQDTDVLKIAGKTATPKDIRQAMTIAMCYDHSGTYTAMCTAFPDYV